MPDIVLIFGTGKVKLDVIRSASRACMNLDGGISRALEFFCLDNVIACLKWHNMRCWAGDKTSERAEG